MQGSSGRLILSVLDGIDKPNSVPSKKERRGPLTEDTAIERENSVVLKSSGFRV